ncbi:hypothetical protein D3C81_610030 [compost metagenome]
MFHLIESIIKADEDTLLKMIKEYESTAKNSKDLQQKLNAELVVDTCKHELNSRK